MRVWEKVKVGGGRRIMDVSVVTVISMGLIKNDKTHLEIRTKTVLFSRYGLKMQKAYLIPSLQTHRG